MKKVFIISTLILSLTLPRPSKADLFGGDVIVLTKILIQTIEQLVQLKRLVGNAKSELDLVRNINRGINDVSGLSTPVFT